MKKTLILALIIFQNLYLFAQKEDLRTKIKQISQTIDGEVCMAMMTLEDKDTLTLNGHARKPMQSVYKFPLAMAIMHQIDKGKFSLDQPIFLSKKEILPNTHSPLRDKYPNGDVSIPLREIIQATVSKSDNIGCDKLFELAGGTKVVQKYIHGLGVKNIAIVATEYEMSLKWEVQFTNWGEPTAYIQLLKIMHEGKALSKKSNDFLMQTLLETSTGVHRIKGLLPQGTPVAHKTGSSGTDEKGINAASNDVGIITLPNGKHVAIAIFVCNSTAKEENRDAVIAQITKAVWDYFIKKP